MDRCESARNLLMEQLDKTRAAIEEKLVYYQDIYGNAPKEELWRLREKLAYGRKHLLPDMEVDPVDYLEDALKMVDLVRQNVASFTSEQLAAFFLGLGFPGLDMPVHGARQALRTLELAREIKERHDATFRETPDSEKWKVTLSIPPDFLFLHPEVVHPSDAAEGLIRLLEVQLAMLAELPTPIPAEGDVR